MFPKAGCQGPRQSAERFCKPWEGHPQRPTGSKPAITFGQSESVIIRDISGGRQCEARGILSSMTKMYDQRLRETLADGFEKRTSMKRSVQVRGKRTSISLEQEFWDAFREIAASRRVRLSDLVSEVFVAHNNLNLSSGIRIFVLNHFQTRAKPSSGVPTD